MFFNSHMKVAAQISVAIEKCLAMALSSTQYCKAGHISLPATVWEDKYIAAFTHHLAGLFVKYDFSGQAWPQKKKDAVFMMALENLCGESCHILVSSVKEGASSPEYKHEFERAISDAASLYLAATDKLEPNYETPAITEAKQAIALHSKEEAKRGIDLAATISALTIGRRINEKYA